MMMPSIFGENLFDDFMDSNPLVHVIDTLDFPKC